MPQINLLSPEAKKKEIRPAIVDAAKVELSQLMRTAIAISVICLVAMLFVWTLLLLSISKKEKILVDLKKKTEVLATNPKEMERLKKEKSEKTVIVFFFVPASIKTMNIQPCCCAPVAETNNQRVNVGNCACTPENNSAKRGIIKMNMHTLIMQAMILIMQG